MDVSIAFKMEIGTLAKATASKEPFGSCDSAEMAHEIAGGRVFACHVPRRTRPYSSGPLSRQTKSEQKRSATTLEPDLKLIE